MRLILFLVICAIFLLLSCKTRNIDINKAQSMCHGRRYSEIDLVPSVSGYDSLAFNSKIEAGKHEDLFYLDKGILSSKKWKWRTSIKDSPSLLFENENYVLIYTFKESFMSVTYYYYSIRKRDGEITAKVTSSTSLERFEVTDDIAYMVFRGAYNKLICVELK
ncbi:MAG: hypothetical protein CSA81_05290 [Acidobacteria bacterium]|nr:MAG: hypothetical protein CSA81_05290 [Acidobacteriota bacterium]